MRRDGTAVLAPSGRFLGRLGLVPQRVQFGKARLLHRPAARGERAFDGAETAHELDIGEPEQSLRIGVQMAREIDDGEQEVADFRPHRIRPVLVERRGDFVDLLADLAKHRARVVPVETDARGKAGKAGGTPSSVPAGAAPRGARSSALMRSHRPATACGVRSGPSANTCGWRRTSLAVIASTTSPKSKAPFSSAMRA